jgi:hypothetical protein
MNHHSRQKVAYIELVIVYNISGAQFKTKSESCPESWRTNTGITQSTLEGHNICCRLVLELSNENFHDAASRWGKAHGITCVLTTLGSFHVDIDHLIDLEAMELGEMGYIEQATHTETRERPQRANHWAKNWCEPKPRIS